MIERRVGVMISVFGIALGFVLCAPGAGAKMQAKFSAIGSQLSGSQKPQPCGAERLGPDSCVTYHLSGKVSQTIAGAASNGTLEADVDADQTRSVSNGFDGFCYPANGEGSIKSGKNVLQFDIVGWICTTDAGACLAGPLSFSVRDGQGTFASATGTGTFNAQSASCFVSNDVAITMDGVVLH